MTAAFIDIHISTPTLEDAADWMDGDAQEKIERDLAILVAGFFDRRSREIMVESEWYTDEYPCPHQYNWQPDACGAETTVRNDYSTGARTRARVRVCNYGHEQKLPRG